MTLRSIDGGQTRQAGQAKEAGQLGVTGQPGATGSFSATGQMRDAAQAGSRPDPRAPQMPWLAIYLTVQDMDASLDFYKRAFGFEPGTVMRDAQGALQHAEMQYKGEIPVMFTPETAQDCTTPSPATLGITMPVFFYLYHDDVDVLFAQAKTAGAKVDMEPDDMFWGDRVASFVCPNGYRWSFATHIGQFEGPPAGAAA